MEQDVGKSPCQAAQERSCGLKSAPRRAQWRVVSACPKLGFGFLASAADVPPPGVAAHTKVPHLFGIAACDIAQEPIVTHDRRVKLALRFWTTCLLCLTPLAQAAAPAGRNILFVLADQWRAQAFGFAGDRNVRTPHLDRFERQCVNFTQAVSGVPVCSPTRASLLTGQRPQTHGVFLNDVPLSKNAVTLPKELKAAGYDTGCIGKWHIDGHGSRSAFIPRERRQGFDYWKVLECGHAYNQSHYYADGPKKLEWDTLLSRKLAAQHDDFRPGPEYVRRWGYQVDANETVPYTP